MSILLINTHSFQHFQHSTSQSQLCLWPPSFKMQFKFLTIVTSILAASSVQAAVPTVNAGDYTTAVTALNKIATNTNSLTASVNKLKTSNLLTTGFVSTTEQDLTDIF